MQVDSQSLEFRFGGELIFLGRLNKLSLSPFALSKPFQISFMNLPTLLCQQSVWPKNDHFVWQIVNPTKNIHGI